MPRAEHASLAPGDVVAVTLRPGLAWLDHLHEIWETGSAILPVDHRLPKERMADLVERGRPTVLVDEAGSRRLDGRPVDGSVAAIVPTSGAGGSPRLVELERRAVEAAVASSAERLDAGPGEPWLCCLPLGYIGGLLVLLRGVLLGSPVSVHPRFDPRTVDADVKVAFTSLVPAMLRRLLDAGADLTRFRAVLVGGAALAPALRDRAERAGASVVETYGLAESCGGVVYDGRPLAGTEVRLDADGGIELAGPTLMAEYRFDPEGSAAAFTGDGWLRTSDVGETDERGRLRVLGRRDDLIITGGEKVWPAEVESALRDHPKVLDLAVAGRPDAEWGQRVVVWVVPADAADPPTLDELRGRAEASLPRWKAPRELVLVAALPGTPSGKVRRAALPRD